MSLLARGEKLLSDRFDGEAVTIIYRRGGEASPLRAKCGKTLFRADDDNGMIIRTESRDFIIRRADLPIAGDPEVGDEVVFCDRVFTVLAPNGEPCWRFHGRLSLDFIRVHTRQTGRVENGC